MMPTGAPRIAVAAALGGRKPPGALVPQYRRLHADPAVFAGRSLNRYAVDIGGLVRKHRAGSLLDYGCGKGEQYFVDQAQLAWGGILPALYDPAVAGLDRLPAAPVDGVICTDVLEHVPADELAATLSEIFGLAHLFVFFSIATRLANRKLPDGRNAHVTILTEHIWREIVTQAVPAGRELDIALRFENG